MQTFSFFFLFCRNSKLENISWCFNTHRVDFMYSVVHLYSTRCVHIWVMYRLDWYVTYSLLFLNLCLQISKYYWLIYLPSYLPITIHTENKKNSTHTIMFMSSDLDIREVTRNQPIKYQSTVCITYTSSQFCRAKFRNIYICPKQTLKYISLQTL